MTEAKKHYASAAKDFNDAKKEATQAIACAATKAGEFVKSTVKSAVEYCKQNPLEVIHGALDVIGMIPALGNIADGLNAAIYLAEGDYLNAAMSAVSLIPFGNAVSAVGKTVSKYGDDVVEAAVKCGNNIVETAAKNSDETADIIIGITKRNDGAADIAKHCQSGSTTTALAIYDPEFAARQTLDSGKTSEDLLRSIVPNDTPNTFVPSDTIKEGYKYNFSVNGKKMEVKWHSQDLNAATKYPGSNSGSGWTAQIKVEKKLLGQDGTFRAE